MVFLSFSTYDSEMSQSKLFKTGDMHTYLETVGGADLSVSRVSLLDLSHVFVHGSSFTSRSLRGSARHFFTPILWSTMQAYTRWKIVIQLSLYNVMNNTRAMIGE